MKISYTVDTKTAVANMKIGDNFYLLNTPIKNLLNVSATFLVADIHYKVSDTFERDVLVQKYGSLQLIKFIEFMETFLKDVQAALININLDKNDSGCLLSRWFNLKELREFEVLREVCKDVLIKE